MNNVKETNNGMQHDRMLRTGVFLLMFIVTGLFIAWKAKSKYDMGMSKERFWYNKKFEFRDANILLHGDSRVHVGLSPAAISKALPEGVKVLNFGFSAGGLNPPMHRHAENCLTKNNKTLRVIVMGITSHSLSTRGLKNEKYHSIKRKDSPLWSDLFDVPRMLINNYRTGTVSRYGRDGWCAPKKRPKERPRAILDGAWRQAVKEGWSVSPDPAILDALFKQTKDWTSQGIQVVAFCPPVPEEVETFERDTFGFDKKAIVRRFTEAGGIWMEISYDGLVSHDGSHLRLDSAVKVSEQLGCFLAEHLKFRIYCPIKVAGSAGN